MIQQTIEAFLQVKKRLTAQRAVLAQLRKEEKALMKEIQDYLNQNEETGIRVDAETVITVSSNEKKINRKPKQYKTVLEDLLLSKGIRDKGLADEILRAKVEHTVQQQKLSIKKH